MEAINNKAVIYARTTRNKIDEVTSLLEDYAREKGLEAVATFKDGMPIRDIANLCDVSPSTVQRVKKIFFK